MACHHKCISSGLVIPKSWDTS